jgi:ribosomal protein S6--L-glutamate ligase
MPLPRLALLSHSDTFYSTRRLLEAAEAQGLSPVRVDPVRVVLRASPRPAIVEDGVELPTPDVLMPRIGAALVGWSTQLVEAWRHAGARCPLSGPAIARAADKLATTLALVAHGIPTVPTVAVREQFHVAPPLLDPLGGGDGFIIKRPLGTSGMHVARAPDAESALSFTGCLVADRSIALVQPFVRTTPTRDVRVLIAGDEPLAACFRVAAPGEFRANVHRGGRAMSASAAELPEGTLELAMRSAAALELPFCGVDLIESPDGPLVLEVNASPGLQGIEEATGRDLAGEIVRRWVAPALA